jgi:DNA-binding MarR family transcriptional regulator
MAKPMTMSDEQTTSPSSGQMNGIVNSADVGTGADECATAVFDVVPQVMQRVRAEMRKRRGPEISVLQLRALSFLRRNPGATLSSLAEYVGLTLPSMSSQVSGLVARKIIDRSISAEDRRFVTLTLTEQGRTLLETARHGTQASLAKTISALTPEERAVVVAGMELLARIFAAPSASTSPSEATPSETPPGEISQQLASEDD